MFSLLRYGNTNTFLIRGKSGCLLLDTDYAGTMQGFYRAMKQAGASVKDIVYVVATHYHPDHAGLISELMGQGVKLLLLDVQKDHVHFPDRIFSRDRIPYRPIDESSAEVITCGESRAFLQKLGICGEIVSTPSHSADSISLVLDDGDCFIGDLEPQEYLEAYGGNEALRKDWELLLAFSPGRVFRSHAPQKNISESEASHD